MANVTQFDKSNLKEIRAGLNALLKTYGDSLGIKFEIGNIGFQANEFHTKLTAQIEGAETKEDRALQFWMEQYNLQEVGIGGKRLVGYRTKARKAPFLFTDPTRPGKTFICDDSYAQIVFKKTV